MFLPLLLRHGVHQDTVAAYVLIWEAGAPARRRAFSGGRYRPPIMAMIFSQMAGAGTEPPAWGSRAPGEARAARSLRLTAR